MIESRADDVVEQMAEECAPGVPVGPGRIYSPDPRDRLFTLTEEVIRSAAGKSPGKADRPGWRTGPTMDQGTTPMCVGFSWAQFLASAPIMSRNRTLPTPTEIYKKAQKLDEWSGENYAGTSVRAGAKALSSMGLIKEYRWSTNMDEFKLWINSVGPAVIGIDWFSGMNRTRGGFLTPEGKKLGGHAIIVVDYSPAQKAFRLLNSWGGEWGENGRAWLDEKDFDYLVFRLNGEACHALET